MPTVAIQAALALPVAERGRSLLLLSEDQWFDRKSARVKPKTLADALIGMANAEGGTIVVGLTDTGVEGVANREAEVNGWRQAPAEFTDPSVPARFSTVACVTGDGHSESLLVIEIEPSSVVHRNTRDEVFIRVGDSNRKLPYSDRQELEYDKGQAFFEARVVDQLTFADLDPGLTGGYAEAQSASDPQRLLKARGLIGVQGEILAAACLLFATTPSQVFPEAYVRIIRYRGTERGTGSRQQIVEDVRCEGPLPAILADAFSQIPAMIPSVRALGDDGLFSEIPLIPTDAWREGLVNAVIHRSYSLSGDHIRFEIFDDRIEIESPGRSPGLVKLRDPLSTTRFARNPRIARALAELDYGQELGEGIKRMFEEMRMAGLVDPVYRETSGSVKLILSADRRPAFSDLRPAQSAVVDLLRQAGYLKTGEIMAAVGISRPTAVRRLRELADRGLVIHVGSGPKDPRGYWKLAR